MADSRHITNHGTADIVALVPLGMPAGMNPRTWRQAIEKRLNELLDQSMSLITALDVMEVDPDLEDGGDLEPLLGWTGEGRGTVALDPTVNHDDDREEVSEDEGAQCDDEGEIDHGIADYEALQTMFN